MITFLNSLDQEQTRHARIQEGGLLGPGPTDRKSSDKLYFMDWIAYREFLICNRNVFPKWIVR